MRSQNLEMTFLREKIGKAEALRSCSYEDNLRRLQDHDYQVESAL